MHVLVACKNEDPIKHECSGVFTTKYMGFSRRSMAAYSEVSGLIWPNFELIRDFIVVHVTCKNEEDPIKNEAA